MTLWHQLHFEGGVDIYQLAKLAHYNRPGIFKTPEDLLFLYCALEAYVTNNGTTIPSPVDIDAWRNSASGYQLNGCVRVSRVYTDSVAKVQFILLLSPMAIFYFYFVCRWTTIEIVGFSPFRSCFRRMNFIYFSKYTWFSNWKDWKWYPVSRLRKEQCWC